MATRIYMCSVFFLLLSFFDVKGQCYSWCTNPFEDAQVHILNYPTTVYGDQDFVFDLGIYIPDCPLYYSSYTGTVTVHVNNVSNDLIETFNTSIIPGQINIIEDVVYKNEDWRNIAPTGGSILISINADIPDDCPEFLDASPPIVGIYWDKTAITQKGELFALSPNPAMEQININVDDVVHYEIYNDKGALIQEGVSDGKIHLDKYAEGLYMIAISVDGEWVRKKFQIIN